RCAEITGLRPEKLLGRTRLEAMGAAADDPHWLAHLNDLEAHRPFTDFTYEVAVPGRGVRSLRISGRPIFDERQRFVGYRGIGDDITEIREAEAAVQRIQRRLESAIGSLDHGFALFDEQDRLVAFNDAYRRIHPAAKDV